MESNKSDCCEKPCEVTCEVECEAPNDTSNDTQSEEPCEKSSKKAWKPPSLLKRESQTNGDVKWQCVLSTVEIDPKDKRTRTATLQSDPSVVGFIIGKNGSELKRLTQQADDGCKIFHKEDGLFEIRANSSQAIGRIHLKIQDMLKVKCRPQLKRAPRKSWTPRGSRARDDVATVHRSAAPTAFNALMCDTDSSAEEESE